MTAPYTKDELLQAFTVVNREVGDYFAALDTETFLAHPPDVWSPRDNLLHLIKAVRPVAQALKAPHLLTKVLFGTAQAESRPYEEIRAVYLQALAAGGRATGRFVPQADDAPPNPEQHQQELLAKWDAVSSDLLQTMQQWSAEELDKYLLPHPLIGKLTVREMLFFTLYHNQHHTNLKSKSNLKSKV